MAVSTWVEDGGEAWRAVARAAATLEERLAGSASSSAMSDAQRRQSDERREAWRQCAARGDDEAFARRLDWLGADSMRLSAALADGASTSVGRDHRWLRLLREVAATTQSFDPAAHAKLPVDPARPLPFEDVFLPLVVVARCRFETSLAAEARHRFGSAAVLALERQLLEGVVELAEDCLMEMFEASRSGDAGLLDRFLGASGAGASREQYLELVRRLWKTGLLDVWRVYPVLARLVATRALLWLEATVELVSNLEADQRALESAFGGDGTSFCCVVGVEPGRSDPHRGFRSVAFLTFASGLRLVYKPRSLALERAYSHWLDWLAQRGAPIALRAPRCLDRLAGASAHGWMEWIEGRPCHDRGGAERFYERAGAHLCLLYFLGACDLHHDNLIACGEHPILVDLETLLQPDGGLRLSEGVDDGTSHTEERFWSSVLRTGFLPRWDLGPDRRTAFDLSALGGLSEQATGWRSRDWRATNTDAMHCLRTPSVVQEGVGAPSVAGAPAPPEQHLGALCAGFAQTYRFLQGARDALLRDGGPLAGLADCRTRVLLRPTSVYYGVLDRALEPITLRSGVLHDVELDALARALLLGEPVVGGGAILQAEQEALRRGDIPSFWVRPDGLELLAESDEDLGGRYRGSGREAARARLERMSEQDLTEQLALIQGTVHARVARSSDGAATSLATQQCSRRQRTASFEDVALRWARGIATTLEQSALRSPEDGAGWIGLAFLAGARRYQLMPLGTSLYDGNAGIALFLAALSVVDRDRGLAVLARAALTSVRTESARRRVPAGIGGLAGLGSLVYAQCRISRLLGDPSLLDDAARAAAAISPSTIARDRELDVVSGAAGALLGLLVLAATSADPAVRDAALDRALLCGEHLLARRWVPEDRAPAWLCDGEDAPLTGFSHGAAGIAYSLTRLYRVVGNPVFRDAAEGGIRYERETFDAEVGNWPDLRRDAGHGERRFGCSWCHGAPGIGLARLGAIDTLVEDEVDDRGRRALCDEIDVAVRAICSTDLIDVDTACCGNFGRFETLLVAALRLSRPHLLDEARTRAIAVLERAETGGGFQLFANLPRHVSNPGFFQGIAGIGYQLLRLAFPGRLPSVLSLE